jgi:hypothetical protein
LEHQANTTYQFEITTSERIMQVFGTVMSHSDEGVLIDLWCPNEPCFSQRVNISCPDIREAIVTLIQERMKISFVSEGKYTIRFLPQ